MLETQNFIEPTWLGPKSTRFTNGMQNAELSSVFNKLTVCETQQEKPLPYLPPEIHYRILSYLPLCALFNAKAVNRFFRMAASEHMERLLVNTTCALKMVLSVALKSETVIHAMTPTFPIQDRCLMWTLEPFPQFPTCLMTRMVFVTVNIPGEAKCDIELYIGHGIVVCAMTANRRS